MGDWLTTVIPAFAGMTVQFDDTPGAEARIGLFHD